MTTLIQYVHVPSLGTGGRLHVLNRMLQAAAADGRDPELVAHLEASIAHDAHTMTLNAAWARQKAGAPPAEAPPTRDLDHRIDRILGDIDDLLEVTVRIHGPGSPLGQGARDLRRALLTGSLGEHVNLPWVEQVAANEVAIAALCHPEHAETVAALRLASHRDELQRLNAAFAEAVRHPPAEDLTYDRVKAARATGRDNLRLAVARLLWVTREDTDDDRAFRLALLTPVAEQAERLRAWRRRRRAAPDLDPETGAELAAPEPTGAEASEEEVAEDAEEVLA